MAAAPTLQAGTWKLDVDDEKSIGLVGRPMSKGVLEFFLVLVRHVCVVLRLPCAVGTHALGQRALVAATGHELLCQVATQPTWMGDGGMKESFQRAEEVLLPVRVDRALAMRGSCPGVRVRNRGRCHLPVDLPRRSPVPGAAPARRGACRHV